MIDTEPVSPGEIDDIDDDSDNDSSGDEHTFDATEVDAAVGAFFQAATAATQQPINWRTLSPEDAEREWQELNKWVDWLRREFALPVAVIPPAWHRHPELVWELSALRQRWLSCYDPSQSATGPLAFMQDFATTRVRLLDWVTQSGTRIDVDRPSRQAHWPGETAPVPSSDIPITNRSRDFVEFVVADVERRKQAQTQALRALNE